MIEVLALTVADAQIHRSALAEILVDCVEGGASVSFLWPYSQSDAECFFDSVIKDVQRGARILLAAFRNAEVVGTVQLILSMPPNQPHRAEVAKLLVRRSARRNGVGEALMREAEAAAQQAGKTLLVLDTASGSAERLYSRLGWTRTGIIPRYALNPDGTWCDTTIFWKDITLATNA